MSAGDGTAGADDAVAVRVADPDDADAVRALLDAAMLAVPADLPARVAAADALVAVEAADGGDGWGNDDKDDSGPDDGDGGVNDDRGDEDGSDNDGDDGDAADGTAGRVVGALVLDGRRIDGVAVRRSRRAAGVGAALVRAAAARGDGPLTATFRPGVRGFYESLGFEVEAAAPDDPESRRLCGRLEP